MWVGPLEVARPLEPGQACCAAARNAARKFLNMISCHVMRVSVECECPNVF